MTIPPQWYCLQLNSCYQASHTNQEQTQGAPRCSKKGLNDVTTGHSTN